MTTITPTNKAVNNVTIAINNKLMAHTNVCNSTIILDKAQRQLHNGKYSTQLSQI